MKYITKTNFFSHTIILNILQVREGYLGTYGLQNGSATYVSSHCGISREFVNKKQ